MPGNIPKQPTGNPRTEERPPDQRTPGSPPPGQPPAARVPVDDSDHEGATEHDVADRTGPGSGYDLEPEQEKDTGGVAES
jgi:hypothetical protein